MDQLPSFLHRAFKLHQSAQLEQAIKLYEVLLSVHGNNAQLLFFLGTAYQQVGKLDQALLLLEQSTIIDPDNAQYHYNSAIVLNDLGRLNDALTSYDRALQINPHFVEALSNRGVILQNQKRFYDALASYDQALQLDHHNVKAHCNRGNALQDLGQYLEALTSYDAALSLDSWHIESLCNRGNAYRNLQRFNEALASYDAAQVVDPNYALAKWNKSLLLLMTGNFLQGWELYEWRHKNNHYSLLNPLHSNVDLKTGPLIFIYAEQGFGDTIQFCRYVKMLADRGARVIFQVQTALQSLISSLDSRIAIISTSSDIPHFDYQSPLLSLPWFFQTTVSSIPNYSSYLSVDPCRILEWKNRLGPKKKKKIGLVWSGNTAHSNDHRRSIDLRQILPLLCLSVEWHSLQNIYNLEDLAILDLHPEILRHEDHLINFSDTGALISQMDLVITVDTAVAHLSGALGKSVWILLPFVPDFRWMLDRSDSPWYPSARLYRQGEDGHWGGVISKLIDDLNTLLVQ
jgi:tetratricopeptide (TPR) repeat protein